MASISLEGATMIEQEFVKTPDGHALFVRDWGSGPPIVLLAGWAMPSDLWGPVMVMLGEKGFRTIAYDRRGHGRSSDPGVVDYDCLADDLAVVLDARDLHRCTVVAHSGAAGEVIRYVTRHGSARLNRIVFVGAQGPCLLQGEDNPHGIPRENFEALLQQLKIDLPGWIDDNIEAFVPGASAGTRTWVTEMILGCSRRVAIDLQRTIAEADLRIETQRLALPVTVIHGELDASCPIDTTGRRYAELIDGAQYIEYQGAAHGLMLTHARRLVDDIAAPLTAA
jgi:pimeloyl-ACP methyl ester carboxylesterase